MKRKLLTKIAIPGLLCLCTLPAALLDFANSTVDPDVADRYPDSDDGFVTDRTGLTFRNVVTAATLGTGYGIDLVISSSNYVVDNTATGNEGATRNGLYGGDDATPLGTVGSFGFIHQDAQANDDVVGANNGTGTYTFTFYRNDTNVELEIDSIRMGFFDIDGATDTNRHEQIVFHNLSGTSPTLDITVSGTTSLALTGVTSTGATVTYDVPSPNSGAVNVPFPEDYTLSELESSVAFEAVFSDTSSFQLDYNTFGWDGGNRALLFSGEIVLVPELNSLSLSLILGGVMLIGFRMRKRM